MLDIVGLDGIDTKSVVSKYVFDLASLIYGLLTTNKSRATLN